MKKGTTILSVLIAIGLLLTMTATSFAMSIDFSGSSSDDTDPSVLKAVVDFDLDLADPMFGMLTVTITNNTADPYAYNIAEVYFNLPDIYMLTPPDLSYWDDDKLAPQLNTGSYSPYADYGTFNVMLDIDKKDKGVKAGNSAVFEINLFSDVFETPPFTVEEFLQADEGSQIAVLQFTKGPDTDEAYAAPGVYDASRGASLPEPATILLFGSGLVGLAGLGRKKGFFKE